MITRSSASKRQIEAVRAAVLGFGAAPSLHGATGEGSRHGIGRDAVEIKAAAIPVQLHVIVSFGVFAREVEEVDTGEDCEETAQKRNGVDSVAGIEASEEDKGCDEGAGGKGYVVQRIDTGKVSKEPFGSCKRSAYMLVLN